MKVIYVVLAGLTILICSCAKKKEEWNELKMYDLNGKVRVFSEYSYKAIEKFGVVEKAARERSSYPYEDIYIEFDKKGNPLEEVKYKSDGRIESMSVCKYDSKGNSIESVHYGRDSVFDSRYTYKYNKKNLILQVVKYGLDNNILNKTNFKYNGKDQLIEEIELGPKDNVESKNTYKYDNEGNKIEVDTYTSIGKLKERNTYKYDNHGNMIQNSVYMSNGYLSENRIYKFDKYGNQIENIQYEDGNITSKYISKYDKDRKKIESEKYLPVMTSRVIYKYDDYGNIIEEEGNYTMSTHTFDSKTTFEYEYDRSKNWIKRIEFEDGVAKYIVERNIEYFGN